MSGELAEAVERAAHYAIPIMGRELDRLRAVEKAAVALVGASDKSAVQDMSLDEMHNLERLLTALTDALNGDAT